MYLTTELIIPSEGGFRMSIDSVNVPPTKYSSSTNRFESWKIRYGGGGGGERILLMSRGGRGEWVGREVSRHVSEDLVPCESESYHLQLVQMYILRIKLKLKNYELHRMLVCHSRRVSKQSHHITQCPPSKTVGTKSRVHTLVRYTTARYARASAPGQRQRERVENTIHHCHPGQDRSRTVAYMGMPYPWRKATGILPMISVHQAGTMPRAAGLHHIIRSNWFLWILPGKQRSRKNDSN